MKPTMKPTPENLAECLDELHESLALDYEKVCDDSDKAPHAAWRSKVVALTRQELSRFKKEANAMLSGEWAICAYCGYELRRENVDEPFKDHIEQCPQHPMSKLKAENERLREKVDNQDKALAVLWAFSRCIYCGKEFDLGLQDSELVPKEVGKLTDIALHITECEKHPAFALASVVHAMRPWAKRFIQRCRETNELAHTAADGCGPVRPPARCAHGCLPLFDVAYRIIELTMDRGGDEKAREQDKMKGTGDDHAPNDD